MPPQLSPLLHRFLKAPPAHLLVRSGTVGMVGLSRFGVWSSGGENGLGMFRFVFPSNVDPEGEELILTIFEGLQLSLTPIAKQVCGGLTLH